ncbi:MAG: PEP-CTERM sorting domain-containing protein [Bryobacteraceae bacterium]
MKRTSLITGVFALVLLLTGFSRPVSAGMIGFDISGTLGPVLTGIDPLHLDGSAFSATGSIDQNAVPISTTENSATYLLPAPIQVIAGNINISGYNASLTVTDSSSGPDIISLDFSAVEVIFTPDVNATLSLPDGTLTGTGIQNFFADFSQPDSTFSFTLPGVSDLVSGTLGVTGTVNMGGGAPSGVPEPGTAAMMLGGLAAVALQIRRARKN